MDYFLTMMKGNRDDEKTMRYAASGCKSAI